MRLLAEVPEGEVGGVQRGSQVRFDIESIGGHPFTGTVAEVRLAPQVAASTASNASTSSNQAQLEPGHHLEPGHRRDARARGHIRLVSRRDDRQRPTGGLDDDRQHHVAARGPDLVSVPGSLDHVCQAGRGDDRGGHLYRGDRRGCYERGHSARRHCDRDAGRAPSGAQAVRIPNNALTFAPSTDSLAAVDQEPPVLSRANTACDEADRDAARAMSGSSRTTASCPSRSKPDRGRCLDRAGVGRRAAWRSVGDRCRSIQTKLVSHCANCIQPRCPSGPA